MKRIYIIFGETAVKRWEDDREEFADIIQEGDGVVLTREFETDEEVSAYIQALDDLHGWNDYSILDEHEYLGLKI